jgi:hypothetical protein
MKYELVLPSKFLSEKIPRSGLGTLWKKVLISRNSVCLGLSEHRNSPFRGSEQNRIPLKKLGLTKQPKYLITKVQSFFFRLVVRISEGHPEYFSPRNGILKFLSSVKWFGTKFCVFSVPRKRRNSDGMNKNFCLFRVSWNNFFLGKWQP